MINGKEINLLNVHNLRQLKYCPPHFTQVIVPSDRHRLSKKDFQDWLFENLQGRFYIGDIDVNYANESSERNFRRDTLIAFEVAEEASYFSLILPNLTKPA